MEDAGELDAGELVREATRREATPPSRLEPLFARPCADQSWGAYGAVRSEDVA